MAIAGTAAWIGYLFVLQSLAVALPDNQVERAYSLAPQHGRIAARMSEKLSGKLSGPGAASADHAKAVRMAMAALRHDPTAVEAVATLGIDALIRGDQVSAKRLFTYSQLLSRRDLRTQLWAIEDAVTRGDIAGALKHYDIALRTKLRTKYPTELLYPVLTSAISDAGVRTELVATLAAKPIWGDSFVYYAVANSSDPRIMAGLLSGLRHASYPIPEGVDNSLINAFLANEQFEEAWFYYSVVRGGADRRRSRDPSFTAVTANPLAFDWIAENGKGISTVIQPRPTGGVFDFAVSPSASGLMLQQLQVLPEGEYVLEGHSVGIDQPAPSRPFWTLSCRDGRELGRFEMPNSSEAGGHFNGHFAVSANCPAQVLSLVARSSSEITGVSGQIHKALLRPAR